MHGHKVERVIYLYLMNGWRLLLQRLLNCYINAYNSNDY